MPSSTCSSCYFPTSVKRCQICDTTVRAAHVRGSLSNDTVVNVEDRPTPPPRNHPLPHPHPQSLSQSDQSLLRTYSSSRPRLTAEAIVRAVSDVFDVANENPPPARPTRNAGFSAASEYDRSSRDTVTFRGRRARAFRHPILAVWEGGQERWETL